MGSWFFCSIGFCQDSISIVFSWFSKLENEGTLSFLWSINQKEFLLKNKAKNIKGLYNKSKISWKEFLNTYLVIFAMLKNNENLLLNESLKTLEFPSVVFSK